MKHKSEAKNKKRRSVLSAMDKVDDPEWLKIQLPTIDSRISFVLTFNGAIMGSEGYIIVNHTLDNNVFLFILLIPTMISLVLCVLGNMPGDILLKYFGKYIAKTPEMKKMRGVVDIKLWFLKWASFCTILTILIIFIGLLDILLKDYLESLKKHEEPIPPPIQEGIVEF